MIDLERLNSECLLSPLSDTMFKRAIASLNRRFTCSRDQLGGYGDDVELVSAYAAFYLPTNMKKLSFVLTQLPEFPLSLDAPLEVVDFGCGPGTYGFALWEWWQSKSPRPQAAFHFVDSAPTMLRQAQKIQQTLYPEMNASFGSLIPPAKNDVRRLVLFGNVVNEMGIAAFDTLVSRMNADAMILIEPGTLDSFQLMKQIRPRLIQSGFNVWYPCATNDLCPLENSEHDWCHQVLKASLAPPIARLGQLASLDRTVMPFIGHVYARHGHDSHDALLLRLKTHSKHAFFWEVCLPGENGLEVKHVELPKKPYSKKEQKRLERISAGQRIRFGIKTVLGNGTWRIENVILV